MIEVRRKIFNFYSKISYRIKEKLVLSEKYFLKSKALNTFQEMHWILLLIKICQTFFYTHLIILHIIVVILMYRKNKVSEILIIDLTWRTLDRRASS